MSKITLKLTSEGGRDHVNQWYVIHDQIIEIVNYSPGEKKQPQKVAKKFDPWQQ